MKNIMSLFSKKIFVSTGIGAVALGALAFAAISVSADAPVSVTATINNANTSAIVATAPIGTLVTNTVLVASSTGPMATGTVDFARYANTTCSGTATVQASSTLVNGYATSTSVALPNTGLSYVAHFNGTGTSYPSMDGSCVSVGATSASTTLTTTISTTTPVLAGSLVTASALLNNMTSTAGGSVVYSVYTNNACTAGHIAAGTGSVTNGIVTNSSTLQFNAPGTYYFQSVYGGDAHNSMATSTCGNAVLTVVATSTPVVNTPPTITLVGANPLYVTVGQAFVDPGATATDTQDGNITANIVKTGTVNTSVVSTTTLVYTITDSGSLSASTTRTVIVTPAPVTTPVGTIGGTVYNDQNTSSSKDAGEPGLSGFTINLYKGAGWWGASQNNPPFMTTTSSANGAYSFANLPDGTYSVEEINQAGWTQTTSDYNSIVVTGGSSTLTADFGNASSTTSNGGTRGKHKGRGNHGNSLKIRGNHGKHVGESKNSNKGGDGDNDNDD